MNIIFDLRNTGLGNNGGSFTIVKCANIFTELGNNIKIIDSFKNCHTWEKLKCEHIIIKNNNDFPVSDVIISTGLKSTKPTIDIPNNKCKLKLHYIRGHETWVYPESYIIENIYKNNKLIKVVNSLNLYNLLKSYNINSYIIHPGYDIDLLYPIKEIKDKKNNNEIIIGGLYNLRHKTKRTDWILKSFNILKDKYKNIKLWMFGSNTLKDNNHINIINKYIKQPNSNEKNIFYNNIDIWLAPTELEGLHIPPAECMLTGGCIIGTNTKLNGMNDYLIDNETGLISKNNINDFINKIEKVILDKELRIKLGKEGRKKILEIGDRKKNMIEFIKLIEKII